MGSGVDSRFCSDIIQYHFPSSVTPDVTCVATCLYFAQVGDKGVAKLTSSGVLYSLTARGLPLLTDRGKCIQ